MAKQSEPALNQKLTPSQTDGVQYHRAKTWQIILQACNALVGMSVYTLIGMATYAGNLGFGLTTGLVGIVIMFSRIFDGITDPLLAFVYDRVETRWGKLRVLIISGFIIQSLGLLGMFSFLAGKGLGLVTFCLCYAVYIIGYTIENMTAQTFGAIMTNDPKQRPTLGVWTTAFNYLVPMILSIVLNAVLLPAFGGEYNLPFLNAAVWFTIAVSALGILLVCIGISEYDKPEYYRSAETRREPLKLKDMIEVLKDNRPLQCYIASNASDKFAQQVMTQSIITTLINGILIGNMTLATILSVISMLPSICFAAVGARYVGKHGSKNGIVTWTKISLVISVITMIFFFVIDTRTIGVMFSPAMIIYVLLTLLQNGSNMCVTTANTSYMADTIDFELDRSGKYIPAVVSGTYSLVDKLITAASVVIATKAISLIGYTDTVPQPTDPLTPGVFRVVIALKFVLPIIGWIITLVAMKFCPLTREEMVNVQRRIADRKSSILAAKK